MRDVLLCKTFQISVVILEWFAECFWVTPLHLVLKSQLSVAVTYSK